MSSDMELRYELEQTLYDEAEALDARRFDVWLEFLTDDVTYWMPARTTRARGDEANEFTRSGEGVAYFDEDRRRLEARVYKLNDTDSWSENPLSRTRHIVSNVRILEKHSPTEVTVGCNFILYRSRLETDEDLWVGRRVDRMRMVDRRWKVARREIYLDQTVLTSKNLSSFF